MESRAQELDERIPFGEAADSTDVGIFLLPSRGRSWRRAGLDGFNLLDSIQKLV